MGQSLIKNAGYNFLKSMLNRFGSLALTIILARLLLPELFGLYSLALSIALLIATFTDLGINNTSIRYISNALSKKNKPQARQYFKFFLKIKILLCILFSATLAILAKPIAIYIFDKPDLYFPLLASALFLLVAPINGILEAFFMIDRKVKYATIGEFIHQIFRIGLPVIAIILLTKENKIAGIFLALSIASLFFISYCIKYITKKHKYLFKKDKTYSISKKRALRFLSFMTISTIGLIFISSIDALMLGIYVETKYIAFYKTAMSIIISIAALLNISAILLPEFSQDNKKECKRIFHKSVKYLCIISIPATTGILLLAKETINAIYGPQYLGGFLPLLVLSPLIFIAPLNRIFITLYNGAEKAKQVAKAITITTIMNILLNFIFIKLFLTINQTYAIFGAGLATLISNIILLLLMGKNAKKTFKIKIRKDILKNIVKPILASIIMAIVMILVTEALQLKSLYKIILIPIGTLTYLAAIFLFKAITKTDIIEIKKSLRSR